MVDLLSPAAHLLMGAAKTEEENRNITAEKDTSGLNYLRDASGKAIDFMSQQNRQKALLQMQQLKGEQQAARLKMMGQNKQDEIAAKTQADKAKHDYENFVTITPDLAQGLYSSTKGKLDFRDRVGSRVMTKVLIPMIQVAGRESVAETKPPSGKGSSQELAALKAFTKEYKDTEKQYSGMELQLKQGIANRNPKVKAQVEEKLKYLQDNKAKYDEAVKKIGEKGGISDTPGTSGTSATATPPPTSASDEDALIDKAFGG